jgi:hypothetical protein
MPLNLEVRRSSRCPKCPNLRIEGIERLVSWFPFGLSEHASFVVPRAGVFRWFAVTAVGVFGWLSLARGFTGAGLLLLALYSALGLDSLGHYALAPMAAHTMAMNSSILVEVAAAALVLLEVLRLLVRRLLHRVGRV